VWVTRTPRTKWPRILACIHKMREVSTAEKPRQWAFDGRIWGYLTVYSRSNRSPAGQRHAKSTFRATKNWTALVSTEVHNRAGLPCGPFGFLLLSERAHSPPSVGRGTGLLATNRKLPQGKPAGFGSHPQREPAAFHHLQHRSQVLRVAQRHRQKRSIKRRLRPRQSNLKLKLQLLLATRTILGRMTCRKLNGRVEVFPSQKYLRFDLLNRRLRNLYVIQCLR
jgi:hypothetical protein